MKKLIFGIGLTFMNSAPSIVPVVPKLQQEPQTAWSLTGVTAPTNHTTNPIKLPTNPIQRSSESNQTRPIKSNSINPIKLNQSNQINGPLEHIKLSNNQIKLNQSNQSQTIQSDTQTKLMNNRVYKKTMCLQINFD